MSSAANTIRLSQRDASHVYEWLIMYWYPEKAHGRCYWCQQLGKRLERLIGPKEVRRIKRIVAKNQG